MSVERPVPANTLGKVLLQIEADFNELKIKGTDINTTISEGYLRSNLQGRLALFKDISIGKKAINEDEKAIFTVPADKIIKVMGILAKEGGIRAMKADQEGKEDGLNFGIMLSVAPFKKDQVVEATEEEVTKWAEALSQETSNRGNFKDEVVVIVYGDEAKISAVEQIVNSKLEQEQPVAAPSTGEPPVTVEPEPAPPVASPASESQASEPRPAEQQAVVDETEILPGIRVIDEPATLIPPFLERHLTDRPAAQAISAGTETVPEVPAAPPSLPLNPFAPRRTNPFSTAPADLLDETSPAEQSAVAAQMTEPVAAPVVVSSGATTEPPAMDQAPVVDTTPARMEHLGSLPVRERVGRFLRSNPNDWDTLALTVPDIQEYVQSLDLPLSAQIIALSGSFLTNPDGTPQHILAAEGKVRVKGQEVRFEAKLGNDPSGGLDVKWKKVHLPFALKLVGGMIDEKLDQLNDLLLGKINGDIPKGWKATDLAIMDDHLVVEFRRSGA